MAAHKEGKVETYFKQQVEAAGGITRKAKWLCRRGCPDQFFAFPKGPNGLAEIKAPGIPLNPHQQREIARLRSAGVVVVTLDSHDAVDHFIRNMA